MLQRFTKLTTAFVASALLLPALAAAHVVVKPAQVGVGAFQTFTIGVPNEKDVAVSGLKLDIPAGLNYVAATVKPGWEIKVDKTGQGESATVTAITWTGGSIPASQRDDFTFSAQAPAKTTDLQWKAYQTYIDGSAVAWDQPPAGADEEESETSGPYSVTKVTNDLTAASTDKKDSSSGTSTAALAAAVLALFISLVAIFRPTAKMKS